MQRLSPRCENFFYPNLEICRALYGDALLVPIHMGTNMVARNQQKQN